jgi:hypothetical protein
VVMCRLLDNLVFHCKTMYIKVTLNKFHKKRNSDISLINWVSYRLQILFWCLDNQNEFNEHTNVQPQCGEFGSAISVCMRTPPSDHPYINIKSTNMTISSNPNLTVYFHIVTDIFVQI